MLSKLSIQGIRSFGADRDEKLEFFSPLTLILGQNGTGKTTIIECLKYITTGVFPPGTKGGAFVHDPKLDHTSEVKGQIKLQFKGGTSKFDCIVHRSMAVTMRGAKGSFKSIDGYLRIKEPGKEPKTISMKCGDLDHEMCSMLGVSKPVLEHVIFCHQEDSSWPLSEGKALKQKFDDIFASGRYAKALDSMMKLQKENLQEIKIIQTELPYLKQNKEKASDIRKKIDNLQSQLDRTENSLERLQRGLLPIQEELNKLAEIEKQAFAVQNELSSVSANYEVLNTQVRDLQKICPPDRQRADPEELKDQLLRLKNRSDNWRNELEKLSQKRSELKERLSQLEDEKQKLALREQQLEMLNRQLGDKRALKDRIASQIGSLLETQLHLGYGESGSQESEASANIIRKVSSAIAKFQSSKSNIADKYNSEEKTIEKDLNDAYGRRAFLENSIREKKSEKTRLDVQLRNVNSDLQEVNTSQAKARQLAADIAENERKLKEAESQSNTEQEDEYNELLSKKSSIAKEQQQLTQQLSKAHKAVEIGTKIDLMRNEETEKEARAEECEHKIRNYFSMMNDDSVGLADRSELFGIVENRRTELKASSTASERELEQSQRRLAATDGNLENAKRGLNEATKSSDRTRGRVLSMLNQLGEVGLDSVEMLDDRIKEVQDQLDSLQHELATATSNESMMKGYIEVIESKEQSKPAARRGGNTGCGHSSCPLCERPFQSEAEKSRVVTSIKSRLSSTLPDRVRQLKAREIPQTKSKLAGLRELKPLFSDRVRFDGDVVKFKGQVSDYQQQSDRMRREAEALRSKVGREREHLSDLASFASDASTLKQMVLDLSDLQERISDAEIEKAAILGSSPSSNRPSNLTASQLSQKLERKSRELRSVEEELESIQSILQENRNAIQNLKSKLLKLQQDKVDIDSKQQKRVQLESDRERIEIELVRTKQSIEEAISEGLPIGDVIEEKEHTRNELRQVRDVELKEITEKAQQLKELQTRFQDAEDEIRRLRSSSSVSSLGSITERVHDLKNEATRVNSECESTTLDFDRTLQEISGFNSSVDSQRATERELQDAIMLAEKRVQFEAVAKKKRELEAKMRQVVGPGKSLRERQSELRDQEGEFRAEKIQAEAHKHHLVDELKKNMESIKSEYGNADKSYREKKANLKVLQMANEDLKAYYRLVDKALLTFHTRKMGEINRIIAEIWQYTYKGGDIDSIVIQSDVDTVGPTEAAKRRTYNYRLVMKKGDTALDMRGRCSAGQKVLASIIIRLALSEAFAGKCHILALDEPTTNLDRENIASLAQSLVKIIEMRAIRNQGGSASNFQLVVITHDTDFIELLGRLCDFADQFYMLERDDRGETRIIRQSVHEISATPG